MLRKIFKTLITLVLILFPFLGSFFIADFSPYIEGNNFLNFIVAYSVAIVSGSVLYFTTIRFKDFFLQPVLSGIILFFIGIVMLGIVGLAAAPDLSVKMLENPEREHFRYILLFIGAFLFGFYFIHLFINNLLEQKTISKQIMIMLFTVVLIQTLWEFYHHYHYPEAMKTWIENGNKAEDFIENYDNDTVGTIGAIGRFGIYGLLIWLSTGLYKVKRVNLWNPIITTFLCLIGIISSIAMFLYFNFKIEVPKEFGFLILFFIPGIPFLILYWIGIAQLTRKL